VLLSAGSAPYAAVVPYSICVVEGWSVVQVIVAEVDAMLDAVTDVITGAETAEVEKTKFVDVDVPAEFPEITA
jgi:hypothetical protein